MTKSGSVTYPCQSTVSEYTWTVGDWLVEPQANRLVRGENQLQLVPKVMDVLCVLIEHAGQTVSDSVLLERVWKDSVVSDASLYQAISQLRKALGDTRKPREYIDRVSARGYVLKASVTRGDSLEAFAEKPLTLPPGWRVKRIFIAGVVLVSSVLVAGSFFLAGDRSLEEVREIERIAVLPFHLSGSEEKPFWLQGFADTVVSRLASERSLHVVTRNDASGFDEEDAGRWLRDWNVDALLLGTVQEDKHKLRVNLRVIEGDGRRARYAEIVDGNVNDLFELQDTVARRLLSVLRPLDNLPDSSPSSSPVAEEAWQNYLLGSFHWSKRTSASLDLAIEYFSRAIAREPGFALSYVGLCDSYHFQYLYGQWPLKRALSLCEPLLDKALEIDPGLGQVHASLGLLALSQSNDRQAGEHLQKAIELAPNYASGWMWYGQYWRNRGEVDRALEYHKKALSLEPLSPIATRNLAFSLLAKGSPGEARDLYYRALELEPEYTNRPAEEMEFLPLTVERAVAFLRWSERFDDRYRANTVNRMVKAQVRLSLGDVHAAQQELAAIPAQLHRTSYYLFNRGLVQLASGQYEAALESFSERMRIESHNPLRSIPVVAVLHALEHEQQALALFLEQFPEFEQIDEVEISRDNAWQFGLFFNLNPVKSAVRSLAQESIRNYLNHADARDWFHVWLLGLVGEQDAAAVMLTGLLESGWLPNHQEILFPIEQDPAFVALLSHHQGHRIKRLLSENRQRVRVQASDE